MNSGTQGATSVNKWYIGTAANNGGQQAMYISYDGGVTAGYTNSANCMAAYTSLTLAAGTYELAFDWQAMGNLSSETVIDGLYVCWIPNRDDFGDSIIINSLQNSTLPSYVNNYSIELTPEAYIQLNGASSWRTNTCSLVSDGTPHRLAFVWRNGVNEVANPGACVDNIQIIDGRSCIKPSNLQLAISGSTVNLSWSGSAASYEVRCYSYASNTWITQITSDSVFVFSNVAEGLCDFYVRSVCEDDLYSTSAYISSLVYFPETRCIDYLTLTDRNCYIAQDIATTTGNIAFSNGMLDFGSSVKESRHTRHTSHTETDPRTGGALKTVPDDEIASVRLGNWNSGKEAERMTFSFTVDAEVNPVLVMKYAVVLENPGHGEGADPRFTLRVLHGNQSLGTCAEADFTSSTNTDGWQIYTRSNSSTPIVWKDWTTVGVNLAEYDGETLTIQLTTYDCNAGGHFGYAYFTLGCSDGQLSGINCGDTPTNEFIAPEGFDYRWYKQSEPGNILGSAQNFMVDTRDTCIYSCDMIFPGDSTCYFTLNASAVPRYPVAEATYTQTAQNCKNMVSFDNTSHVMTINQISNDSVHITTDRCQSVTWDFGDGTHSLEYSPTHEFPQEGGTYHVTMSAGISDDMCTDVKEFDIVLPKLGTTIDTVTAQGCLGTAYQYNGTAYWNTGIYVDTLTSTVGCDSIIVLDLTMSDRIEVQIDTLICSDSYYVFDGDTLRTTGTYRSTLESQAGCDSITTLSLTVHPMLRADIDNEYTICAQDALLSIPYSITNGSALTYSLTFSDEAFADIENASLVGSAIEVDMPQTITPNVYEAELVLIDSICGDVVTPITFTVNYADTTLTQRWNDVIGIRNETYNGGYTFTSYQWYKDGVELVGETKSYLYVPDGLDMNAEYTAKVTRNGDGVELFICPIVLEYFDSNTVPTLVIPGEDITISSTQAAVARFYSFMGNLISATNLTKGMSTIKAPSTPGVYVLELIYEDGHKTVHRVMVRL